MNKIIATIALVAGMSFAADCVTTNSAGEKVVASCTESENGSIAGTATQEQLRTATQTRNQYENKSAMDSSAYQAEVQAKLQTRLQTMTQAQADQAELSGEATQTRTQARKAQFIENKGSGNGSGK
ncbi:MAG TPA: hypothetical protein VLM37_05255 [Fibrobacteraceae bacterium]|nr:hypothetical protein [Fibrobacteraceae bacterium]